MKRHDHAHRLIRSGKSIFTLIIMLAMISCGRPTTDNQQTVAEELIPDSVYESEGNRIVAVTFDTLRNSLLHTISSHGIDSAIKFCNENAYELTTTYADSVTIRRTAMRYRNPENKPDSLEQFVLGEVNSKIKSGTLSDLKVVRRTNSGEIHFFKPILLQPMCLNCHGKPGTEIQPSTLARIQDLYPDDRATNFSQGDLRGMWHITFTSDEK